MEIWPAIDLLGGKCVRLQQGDYARDTVFGENPAEMASRWIGEGASRLHCVDLDGAKSGSQANEPALRAIRKVVAKATLQVGGGVRNEETIRRWIDLGVDRLVVGTTALKQPDWFATMCDKYPGMLVLGLDARDGMVATEGWQKTSQQTASELLQQIQQQTENVAAVVYTDIARDGMMAGTNIDALVALQKVSRFPVIASGGVTDWNDIEQLLAVRAAGCILGRTLYEGRLKLNDVLKHVAVKSHEGMAPGEQRSDR
jgi:phosphoribosylformimino-5-aminoimidazole carboxamide ribotide isomerase